MGYETLTVAVPGGEILATRRGMGEGPPALLLHGGPGVGAEMIIGLVEELDGLIDGVLPQQRGLHPSTLEGPRDVETHVADAVAILDHLGWERAWMIGHSWGGHLAMHVAVAHPERVTGIVGIETLGAIPDGGSGVLTENLVARLTPEERAYLDALLEREAEGDDDPGLMAEILLTLWPSYSYVHGNVVPPSFVRLERPLDDGHDTMPSVAAHFEAGTLEHGLPGLALPALFLHGEGDPLPSSASVDSAALIPGARVELIDESGHFPWLERKGVVRAAVEALLQDAG
jgi:pimeloyl-ACP methyl ester carboxylesterase